MQKRDEKRGQGYHSSHFNFYSTNRFIDMYAKEYVFNKCVKFILFNFKMIFILLHFIQRKQLWINLRVSGFLFRHFFTLFCSDFFVSFSSWRNWINVWKKIHLKRFKKVFFFSLSQLRDIIWSEKYNFDGGLLFSVEQEWLFVLSLMGTNIYVNVRWKCQWNFSFLLVKNFILLF